MLLLQEPTPSHVAVKEVVLPFNKFPGADTLLGPEMRSTGEVMGIDYDFASSYAKAQIAAGARHRPAAEKGLQGLSGWTARLQSIPCCADFAGRCEYAWQPLCKGSAFSCRHWCCRGGCLGVCRVL